MTLGRALVVVGATLAGGCGAAHAGSDGGPGGGDAGRADAGPPRCEAPCETEARWHRPVTADTDLGLRDVAVGPDGSVTVVGYFATYEENGTLSVEGAEPIGSDGITGFVIRYDAAGELLWLRRLSNGFLVQPSNVAAGPDGSVLVGGPLDRDGLDIDGLSARCDASRCAFTALLDVEGTVRTLTPFWGFGEVHVSGVSRAPWGYLVVGCYLCSFHIADEELSDRACSGEARFASFTARVDAEGRVLSVTHITPEEGSGVVDRSEAVDAEGRVALALLSFGGTVSIGGTEIAPETSSFVAAWPSEDAEPWLWPLGSGLDRIWPSGLAWTGDDVVLAGKVTGPTADGDDPFAARQSAEGLVWSRALTGGGDHWLTDVAVTDDGGIVVAGAVAGATDLGAGPVASGPGRGIVARLDGGGGLVWQHVVPGDGSRATAVDTRGDVVAALEVTGDGTGAVRVLAP